MTSDETHSDEIWTDFQEVGGNPHIFFPSSFRMSVAMQKSTYMAGCDYMQVYLGHHRFSTGLAAVSLVQHCHRRSVCPPSAGYLSMCELDLAGCATDFQDVGLMDLASNCRVFEK